MAIVTVRGLTNRRQRVPHSVVLRSTRGRSGIGHLQCFQHRQLACIWCRRDGAVHDHADVHGQGHWLRQHRGALEGVNEARHLPAAGPATTSSSRAAASRYACASVTLTHENEGTVNVHGIITPKLEGFSKICAVSCIGPSGYSCSC